MLFNLKALAPALLLSAAAFAATVKSARDPGKKVQVSGIDVWSVPANISWKSIAADGIHFVYITATEGIDIKNPDFTSQSTGAANAGLFRGAYHTALPYESSGTAQAEYFVANGGKWIKDGITLPGAVVLATSAHTPVCYTLSAASMVSWIRDFSNTYHSSVGRYPVIHTTFDWWNECTDNYAGFGSTHPLWLYTYAGNLGLPAGWSTYTFFEDDTPSPVPDGSHDIFNGDISSLKHLAVN